LKVHISLFRLLKVVMSR